MKRIFTKFHSSPFTFHSSLPTSHFPLFTSHSSLTTSHSSLPTPHFPLPTSPRRRAGFTLIELLTVMGVMILISTVVVTSGFGMRRSAAINSARQIPLNVLEYAHQRACMDGRRTAVLFAPNGDDSGEFAASLFQASGFISDSGAGYIRDKYSDVAKIEEGGNLGNLMKVFGFEKGKTFIVKKIMHINDKPNSRDATFSVDFERDKDAGDEGDNAADGKKNVYWYPGITIYCDERNGPAMNSSDWPKGSAYGFEISDRVILPSNFTYKRAKGGESIDKESFWVVFNPDGSLEKGELQIDISETGGKQRKFDPITYK